MQNARKMLLVDPRVMDKFAPPTQTQSPIQRAMIGIDREMRDIVEDTVMPESDKVKAYEEALQRHARFNQQFRQQPTMKVEIAPSKQDTLGLAQAQALPGIPITAGVDPVISRMPAKQQTNAKSVLAYIDADPNLGWNEKGEFLVNNKAVEGSNKLDLLTDVVGSRKDLISQHPGAIVNALKASLLPRALVRNKKLMLAFAKDPSMLEQQTTKRTPFKKSSKSTSKRQPSPHWDEELDD